MPHICLIPSKLHV
ncbi:hypothetical protein E2C01_060753 [Portunus trituberculatus]|uniref:Uncharacterized protein n=1 Tax=Portunus trituberculatus TaxID=210409 RepID=A0A5B7H8Z9_PORTR|nr:hypothetical protein [Portunus trituberculatus]